MVGYLGEIRWLGGLGKVGETMCHVSIACIHHSTLTYPFLGESLVQIWENLLGVLPMGGTMGWFIGSVLPIGHKPPQIKAFVGFGGSCPLCSIGGRRLEVRKPLTSNTFGYVPSVGMSRCGRLCQLAWLAST